jgi:glutamate-1-semialdehyde 2,1-aminomutase
MTPSMLGSPDGYPTDAGSLLPGGVGRSILAVGPEVPRLIGGSGFEVEDAEGRVLIDLNNNFTVNVHGNAHPAIVAAVQRAIAEGASFGAPSTAEYEHAEVLLQRLANADQVRYANSGTEAMAIAIRMARAVTGRDHIVALEGAYHGSSETALCTSTSAASLRGLPGAIQSLVTTVTIGDLEALRRAVDPLRGSLAAIIIDLAPNRPGLVPLSPSFRDLCRELADSAGARLIVDEVITFRLARGGFQQLAGLRPDLTVLGKVIGGGLPVGAVVGSAGDMSVLDPFSQTHIDSSGTFTGNPVTMRAGQASLELLDEDAIERLNRLGERLRRGLREALPGTGRWLVQGVGSLVKLMPDRAATPNPKALAHSLWWAAYRRSVLITPNGTLSVSTPMTEQVIDRAVELLGEALSDLERDRGSGDQGVDRHRPIAVAEDHRVQVDAGSDR